MHGQLWLYVHCYNIYARMTTMLKTTINGLISFSLSSSTDILPTALVDIILSYTDAYHDVKDRIPMPLLDDRASSSHVDEGMNEFELMHWLSLEPSGASGLARCHHTQPWSSPSAPTSGSEQAIRLAKIRARLTMLNDLQCSSDACTYLELDNRCCKIWSISADVICTQLYHEVLSSLSSLVQCMSSSRKSCQQRQSS